jgi:hypothetical protein
MQNKAHKTTQRNAKQALEISSPLEFGESDAPQQQIPRPTPRHATPQHNTMPQHATTRNKNSNATQRNAKNTGPGTGTWSFVANPQLRRWVELAMPSAAQLG